MENSQENNQNNRDKEVSNFEKILFRIIISGCILSSTLRYIENYQTERAHIQYMQKVEKIRADPRYKLYGASRKVEEMVKDRLTYKFNF